MLGITKLLINLQEKNLWLVIGLFILAILLAFLTYRRTYPPISKRKKALLLSLRIVALFSLFLLLSEPILTIARRFIQEPVMAILVDTSKSMNLKGTQASRKEELQNLLKSDLLEKLSSKSKLEIYGFADTIFPLNLKGDFPDSLGKATSIGEATKSVEEKLKDKNLRGILILSDGANNLGEDPIFVAKSKEIPIYTCGIGEYIPPKDIAIERIVHHDIGYVDNKIPIQVDISQVGFDKLKIPISIKKISGSGGKETQAQKNLTLSTSGGTQTLEFAITPKEEGLHQYELTVPQQKEELVKENNRRIFSIKVLKSKIKVLLVTGSLNWEYTFLKRALEKDKNIELKSLVYGKNKKIILGRFPQGEKEL
ncbi:MAG: VWA domain-containing protein, partial [candidate division Zixibacteria bacterium]|nr:VWA domain-containing protein [candidate division Zixibacteria bacterium]